MSKYWIALLLFALNLMGVKCQNYAADPTSVYPVARPSFLRSAITGGGNIYRDTNLAGYWQLNRAAAQGFDFSGNKRSGALSGTSAGDQGYFSLAGKTGPYRYLANGTSDVNSVAYFAGANPASSAGACAWVNFNSLSGTHGIINHAYMGGWALELNASVSGTNCSTNLCAVFDIGGTYYAAAYATSSLSTGKDYYACGSYDGSAVTLYLNGSPVSTVPASGTIGYAANYAICLGSSSPQSSCATAYYSGLLAGVRFWSPIPANFSGVVAAIYAAENK